MSGFTFSPFVRAAAVIVGLAAFVLCSTHFPGVSATVNASVFGKRIKSHDDLLSSFKEYEPLKEDEYNPMLMNFADDEDTALIRSEDDDLNEFGMVAVENKTSSSSSDVIENFRSIVNRVIINNKKTSPSVYYRVFLQLVSLIQKTGKKCIKMARETLIRGCTTIGNGCLKVAKRIFGENCTSLGNALTRLIVVLFESGFSPSKTLLRLAVIPILKKMKSYKIAEMDEMTSQDLMTHLESLLENVSVSN